MWNEKRLLALTALAGALVLVGCAGRAGQTGSDDCDLAGQHVAECTGITMDGKTCGPGTAQLFLSMSCEDLQSQLGERSSQGFFCDTWGWCSPGEQSCGYGFQEGCYGEEEEEPQGWNGGWVHFHSNCCFCPSFEHAHHPPQSDRYNYEYFKRNDEAEWVDRDGWPACDLFGSEDTWFDNSNSTGGSGDVSCCHQHWNGPGTGLVTHINCHHDEELKRYFKRCSDDGWRKNQWWEIDG